MTVSADSLWTGGPDPGAVDDPSGVTTARLTIAPSVTLTSRVPVTGKWQIGGGGTLYMATQANNYVTVFTVSQGRLRADDLSLTGGGGSVLWAGSISAS